MPGHLKLLLLLLLWTHRRKQEQDLAMTKIALVTGASRGLGNNTALRLARKGIDAIASLLSEDNRWINA